MTMPEMSVWQPHDKPTLWQRIAAWWRELSGQELTIEETGW